MRIRVYNPRSFNVSTRGSQIVSCTAQGNKTGSKFYKNFIRILKFHAKSTFRRNYFRYLNFCRGVAQVFQYLLQRNPVQHLGLNHSPRQQSGNVDLKFPFFMGQKTRKFTKGKIWAIMHPFTRAAISEFVAEDGLPALSATSISVRSFSNIAGRWT